MILIKKLKVLEYRELIKILTITDLKNRYQNTTLGFLWSVLNPLLLALVLYFIFTEFLFKDSVDKENFALNILVGIMAWRFFANGTTMSLFAIVGKPNLVTKVYIPRHILVISNALSNLISSTLEFIILLPIIFALLGTLPVSTPLFLVIHLLYFWLILGVGLVLSALYVYLRDLNQIWEVLLNIGFFLSPIIYPLSFVEGSKYYDYYMLNPITRLIVMYRDVMIDGDLPTSGGLVIVIVSSILTFILGSLVFNKLQRRFAEEI